MRMRTVCFKRKSAGDHATACMCVCMKLSCTHRGGIGGARLHTGNNAVVGVGTADRNAAAVAPRRAGAQRDVVGGPGPAVGGWRDDHRS